MRVKPDFSFAVPMIGSQFPVMEFMEILEKSGVNSLMQDPPHQKDKHQRKPDLGLK